MHGSNSHLSARQWRVPAAALTMAVVVACYVHYSMKNAKREVELERQIVLDERDRRRAERLKKQSLSPSSYK
ncbi:hypothetical protein CPB86DRAFT_788922 [Serendipita vermifera]|nr:hypothetical protein CPB86DRAFT_788922 [Serendipita vermifera]